MANLIENPIRCNWPVYSHFKCDWNNFGYMYTLIRIEVHSGLSAHARFLGFPWLHSGAGRAEMATKSKRWSRAETLYLIQTLEDLGIIQRADGRKYKNAELYKAVADKMREDGYLGRDATQVHNRWKLLKQEYNKARTKNKTSGSDPLMYPFFDELDRLLGGRPRSRGAGREREGQLHSRQTFKSPKTKYLLTRSDSNQFHNSN